MLFQAVVIFLPILNFFKFHVKGERSIATDTGFGMAINTYILEFEIEENDLSFVFTKPYISIRVSD